MLAHKKYLVLYFFVFCESHAFSYLRTNCGRNDTIPFIYAIDHLCALHLWNFDWFIVQSNISLTVAVYVIYSKWIPIEMKCVFNLQLAGDYLNWIICDQIMNYCKLLAQLSWHQTCRGATEGELNEWGMLLNLWLIKITRWHELNQNRHTLTGHKNNRVSSMVGIQSEQNIV